MSKKKVIIDGIEYEKKVPTNPWVLQKLKELEENQVKQKTEISRLKNCKHTAITIQIDKNCNSFYNVARCCYCGEELRHRYEEYDADSWWVEKEMAVEALYQCFVKEDGTERRGD